jgi:zinc transport system substrate-binding protein
MAYAINALTNIFMNSITKKIIFLILIGGLVGLAAFYSYKNHQLAVINLSSTKKITVITTIFPLYDLARIVGGSEVEVSLLLPPGVEPHAFEPKPSDLTRINQADIFIYTNRFMEPWATDLIAGVNNSHLLVIDSSRSIKLMTDEQPDRSQSSAPLDPHVWLDFANLEIMLNNIRDGLIATDPTHTAEYQQNAAAYAQKLQALDRLYRDSLNNCANREIIYGGHYAFGYLAKRYHLTYLAAQGLAPDAEPSAHDLVQLIEQIKTQNIKYIFYEELSSPKIASTLAQ